MKHEIETIEQVGKEICKKHPLCKDCGLVKVCLWPLKEMTSEAVTEHAEKIIKAANNV